MTNWFRQRAVTLLEMLMVVVIIGAMAVAGVNTYNHRVQLAKADRTARLINEWMVAAQGYQLKSSAWPSSLNALISAGYMTNDALKTPYTSTIALAADFNPDGNMFGISITLPNTKIAGWVANRLANATVSGATVTTYATLPSVGPPKHILKLIDVLPVFVTGQSSVPVPKRFSCPLNHKMYFDAALMAIYFDRNFRCAVEPSPGLTVDYKNWRISIESTFFICGYERTGTALVFVWCCGPDASPATCPTRPT